MDFIAYFSIDIDFWFHTVGVIDLSLLPVYPSTTSISIRGLSCSLTSTYLWGLTVTVSFNPLSPPLLIV